MEGDLEAFKSRSSENVQFERAETRLEASKMGRSHSLILGLVWGYLEIRYAQSYFFGGAAIVLTALASYELYKYSPRHRKSQRWR